VRERERERELGVARIARRDAREVRIIWSIRRSVALKERFIMDNVETAEARLLHYPAINIS